MALVFLHLFPLLENVGFCLGSVGKKAGWGVESGAGMRALGRESSKGVSWRGCGPSSFVMDVFILKTKVPFSAGTAGIGGRSAWEDTGGVLRSLVQAFPQVPRRGFLLKVICKPRGSLERTPKGFYFAGREENLPPKPS